MARVVAFCAAWMFTTGAVLSVIGGDVEKYALRYKFRPGETIRWDVEQRLKVRVSVSGSVQTVETVSKSEKLWRVTEVRPDGTAVFTHSVPWVDMRQSGTGRDATRYDSRTGDAPPVGFGQVPKRVGVPLMVVTIDPRGKVLGRDRPPKSPPAPPEDQSVTPQEPLSAAAPANAQALSEGWLTIPLPDGPVAAGHTWSLPIDIEVPLPGGGVKRVKAIQQFTLENVKTGVASIAVSTAILTPITDPAIESQLLQRESTGRVRFDIDAGRVIGQQIDVDKRVVGFRGEASSIHYANRFTERILPAEPRTAAKHATSGSGQ